ncbi:MAG: hypothetical protein DRH30_05415 [Deltaproteobacteria bacterium]|nr:MAG: hypothetical protein DRH30_05415 [Deltaproteobacteria bacterium]
MKQSLAHRIRRWAEANDADSALIARLFKIKKTDAEMLVNTAIPLDLSGLTEKKRRAVERSRRFIEEELGGEIPECSARSDAGVSDRPPQVVMGDHISDGNYRRLRRLPMFDRGEW